MASTPNNDGPKGAKRRTGIPMRAVPTSSGTATPPRVPEMRRVVEDPGRDSGLSSESTTPTNGSPPPRQPKVSEAQASSQLPTGIPRRQKMVDIIAASKARLQESERCCLM